MTAFLESAKKASGGSTVLVGLLAVMVALDFLTAVLSALSGRGEHLRILSRRIGFAWVARKALIFVIVGVAYVVDETLGETVFCPITMKALIVNEAIVTLRNVSLVGTWIPPVLRNGLGRLTGETGKKTESK